MLKECIVHVGMHKTGSSSIQDFFFGAELDGITYLDMGGYSNHSGYLSTILLEKPHLYHAHLSMGRGQDEVDKLRLRYLDKLRESIKRCTTERMIISAEDLSHRSIGESGLMRLKHELAPYFEKISVIGYVRRPIDYVQSAFQQIVKEGSSSWFSWRDLPKIVPRYRGSFEPMDAVFGRENVTLIPFVKTNIKGGDVVVDFCE
ncbi:MAG: hypothetical protein AB1717_08050 [Pseudomonadota bacterium]